MKGQRSFHLSLCLAGDGVWPVANSRSKWRIPQCYPVPGSGYQRTLEETQPGLSHHPPELMLNTEKEVLTAGGRDNVTTPWAYS